MRSAAVRASSFGIGDGEAEGVGELRAGQHAVAIDVRFDFTDCHGNEVLRACWP